MYMIGFNGPPMSGKDTLAEMVARVVDEQIGLTVPVKLESLSLPLREVAHAMVGRPYNESEYAAFKEEVFPAFGQDGRHLMIDVSERFLKPVYGQEIMAQMLIERNRDFDGLLLVRDSGFDCEVAPLINAYGMTQSVIVQVQRAGKTFEALNDSREWVYHTMPDQTIMIDNDSTLQQLEYQAWLLVQRLRNDFGWKL